MNFSIQRNQDKNDYYSDQMKEILDYKHLFPIKEIEPAGQNHFFFEKEKLPRQVKSLIDISNPNSISSGSVFFHGEELFWISSSLKFILFNPKKLSNVIEYDIDYPIQMVFSSNLYLILSHIESYVTLMNFPYVESFSEMFDNTETEEYNFYEHIKNKKNILKLKLYPKMLRPVPSSFYITTAYDNFVGCSDGIIRAFQVVGHWPDSNFFMKRATYGFSSTISSRKKIPILSLKKSGNYLYSIDALNNLTAYLIANENQVFPIGSFNFSNITSITPFSDFILSIKEIDGKFIVSTVLNSQKWYRIKKSGVIISQDTSKGVITKYDDSHSCIYRINGFKESNLEKKENSTSCIAWPVRAEKRVSGNTVIIYIRYFNDKSKNDLKFFEYQVEAGDIITFAYDDFNPPIPFISSKDQFFSFNLEENKENVEINYILRKKQNKRKGLRFIFDFFRTSENELDEIKNTHVKPIDFFIQEIDECKDESSDNTKETANNKKESPEDIVKKCCLCVIGEYPLIPNSTIETEFGINTVHHSVWSTSGSLFCIIDNIQPNFGKLLTMQFGIQPVAHIQCISGRIFAYNTNNKSDDKLTKFSDIKKGVCDTLYIFTSECLLIVSLNEETTYKQKVAWNSLKHLYSFWLKKSTIKNLSEFRKMFNEEFKETWEQIIFKFNNIIRAIAPDKYEEKDANKLISNYHINAIIDNQEAIITDLARYIDRSKSSSQKEPTNNRQKIDFQYQKIINQKVQNPLDDLEDLNKLAQNCYKEFTNCTHKRDIEGFERLIREFEFNHTETDSEIQRIKDECSNEITKAQQQATEKIQKLQNHLIEVRKEGAKKEETKNEETKKEGDGKEDVNKEVPKEKSATDIETEIKKVKADEILLIKQAQNKETQKIEEIKKRKKIQIAMLDCFLVWTSEEINKLLTIDDDDDDDDDDETSEFIINLSRIRDRLMNFQENRNIFE